jgi:hypothetical protein
MWISAEVGAPNLSKNLYGDPHKKEKRGKQDGTKIGTRRKDEGYRVSIHRGSPCGHRYRILLTRVYQREAYEERVVLDRQEEEVRRSRKEVHSIVEDDEGEEDVMDDDEREIWEVTRLREEELDTTEVEGVDFLAELLHLVGWSQVNDEETEKDLSCRERY